MSEIAGIGKQSGSQQRKDRCKCRCTDAYFGQHLSPHPSPPPRPKGVSKAMLSWMTEMVRAHRRGMVGNNGAGTAAGRAEGDVTSTFSCSLLFRLSSLERADVALALNLLKASVQKHHLSTV